jgi:hypothetical protein
MIKLRVKYIMILSQGKGKGYILKVVKLVLRFVLEEKLQTFCYISFFYVMCIEKKIHSWSNLLFYTHQPALPLFLHIIIKNSKNIF